MLAPLVIIKDRFLSKRVLRKAIVKLIRDKTINAETMESKVKRRSVVEKVSKEITYPAKNDPEKYEITAKDMRRNKKTKLTVVWAIFLRLKKYQTVLPNNQRYRLSIFH